MRVVGALRWMRSELKEDYLDASLSRGDWWEDHHGLEIRRCALLVLVTISNSSFSLHAFMLIIFSMLYFNDYYVKCHLN